MDALLVFLLGTLKWFVGIGALAYGGLPLLIKSTQMMQANPHLEELDASGLPPAASEFIYTTANILRQDGFVPEAYLQMPNQMPHVQAYLIMLTNRAAGDKAMVTVILQTVNNKPPSIGTKYVEFSTRFRSGTNVDTMNSPTLGSFKAVPGEYKTRVPQVTDPHLLYRIHRWAMETRATIAPDDEPVVYEAGQAADYLKWVLRKSYEEQASLGQLTHDVAGGVYRPTLTGAYRMTWRELFPVKQYLLAQDRAQAAKTLAAFLAETSATGTAASH